jgi:cytochrome P450
VNTPDAPTHGGIDAPEREAVEIDFDHHSPEYAKRWREISDQNLSRCPVAHTSAHGGFWVLSDHRTVGDAARDDATFSSFHDVTGDVNNYEGIVIPPSPILQVPIELDPPESTGFRKILNPLFSPARSRAYEPVIRSITTACLDRICEAGEGDLVLDLGGPVPTLLTMQMLGLPLEHGAKFADAVHKITYMTPSSEGYGDVLQSFFGLVAELVESIPERRANPGDDLISQLVLAEIDGEPLTDEQITSVCTLVIAGGVDTTTSLFAEALVWLDQHPDQRQRLIDEPELLPTATEEFLRYFTPQQLLARTATRDVEVGGQIIREGERVMLSWAAANRDPAVFEAPDEVRLDRTPNRHTTFGLGLHRCLGSNLARIEFGVMLSELLRRMPDFRIDHDRAEPYPSIGVVNGWISLPSRFTPSAPEGSDFTF